MANQSKLKAWVRYDGTNTVVTAGPIFRASKPKVGNWRQINADLCCNPSSGTTTTTTTSGGNITTTTSTTQALTFYNADYRFGPSGNICIYEGQFNLPIVFPDGIATAGDVSLAPGYTWAQFGIDPGVSLRVKDSFSPSVVYITVQSGSAGYNNGVQESC